MKFRIVTDGKRFRWEMQCWVLFFPYWYRSMFSEPTREDAELAARSYHAFLQQKTQNKKTKSVVSNLDLP